MDYIIAFQRIVLPLVYEFAVEFAIVIGPEDEKYSVSAEAFSLFIYWLTIPTNGRVIITINGNSLYLDACIRSLLGDPLPTISNMGELSINGIKSIQTVLQAQQNYWKCLKFNKKLPENL